ncbi:hypothetical protein [Oceanisphaera arctica]|uniref:hypothetical protein n=1 Tax=Oceanisphaera arctica TaxID=641510 RepID=UPI00198CC0D2|nr:hypothetical protein [Oceanisphaera arctica]GHA10966.1 hypothetical protein GCM10007082_09970 [Oceanisphaera arctica]
MSILFESHAGQGLTRELIEVLFPMFEQASAGAIAVDRNSCITWINSRYASCSISWNTIPSSLW